MQGSRPDEALDLDLALPVRSEGNQTAAQAEGPQEPLYAAISSAAVQGSKSRQQDAPKGLGSFLPLPRREANPGTSGDIKASGCVASIRKCMVGECPPPGGGGGGGGTAPGDPNDSQLC